MTVHLDVGRLCGTSMCHPSGGDGFEIDISQKLKNLAHLLGDEILAPDWNNPTTKVCIISVNQK